MSNAVLLLLSYSCHGGGGRGDLIMKLGYITKTVLELHRNDKMGGKV